MTFSETVDAAVAKGWGVTDERKIAKEFGVTLPMASKVALACEDAYQTAANEARARGAALAKLPKAPK